MNISIRLFAGFFLIVGLAVGFVLHIFNQEIAPGIRQATEETLVDSANMLAEMATPELRAGTIGNGRFAAAVKAAGQRELDAQIFDVSKKRVDFRVYVTDAKGIVRFDTLPGTLGADYSQWNDVMRVLRGEYGARSSRDNPYDPDSSFMYVAAPVLHQGELIGVLSIAKPSSSIKPYLERAEERIRSAGLIVLGVASAIGIAFTLWLAFTIERLRAYAKAVSEGRPAVPPTRGGSQFGELARALALMRERLDGKQYVETYVQNLAHEMKSPLTAISGSAELLLEDLPEEDRSRFIQNIQAQADRLSEIIERMLQLASLEQLQSPASVSEVRVHDLFDEVIGERVVALRERRLQCDVSMHGDLRVKGDRLLLQQALLNLLDNAIDFSPTGGQIVLAAHESDGKIEFNVLDHGPGAPEYALPRLFDRFYSLPRPDTERKSTGLGLSLVAEIARLHGGEAGFRNHPEVGGVAFFTATAA